MTNSINETNAINSINDVVFEAIQSFSDSSRKTYNKKGKAVDAMLEAGYVPKLFTAPKENAEEQFTFADGTSFTLQEIFEGIKVAVIAGFTASEKELLNTPTKSLPQHKKDEKKTIQQRIGSVTRDLRVSLEKRLDPPKKVEAEPTNDTGAENVEAANDTGTKVRIAEKLIAAMKIAQKDESPDYEIFKLVKAITAAMAALGEEFPKE